MSFSNVTAQIVNICAGKSHQLPPGLYNTGGPGLFLERLMGVEANNRDTADLADTGIELKTGSKRGPLTMFHRDPIERSQRASKKAGRARVAGALQRLVDERGYLNGYGNKAFQHMIYGQTPTTTRVADGPCGYYVKIEADKINLYHENEVLMSWSTDTVINILVSKMRRLILVQGKRSRTAVDFKKATLYQELRVGQIAEMILDGTIMIDIDAYYKSNGKFRNHGVKFRIDWANVGKLYLKSHPLCDYT
jgi:hypothetical protein